MLQTNNIPICRRLTVSITVRLRGGHARASLTIQDSLTGERYTCENVSLPLPRAGEKDPVHTRTAEEWLRRTGALERAVFPLYCSAAAKEEARKRAAEQCLDALLSLLYLLHSFPSNRPSGFHTKRS